MKKKGKEKSNREREWEMEGETQRDGCSKCGKTIFEIG